MPYRFNVLSGNFDIVDPSKWVTDSSGIIYSPTSAAGSVTIKGYSGQTASLQQWQDSSGTVLSSVDPTGGLRINSTGTPGTVEKFRINTPTTVNNSANAIIAASSTTATPLVVQGAASQTANLQEWRNSANTLLSSINSDGALQLVSTEKIRFGAYATGLTIEASDGVGTITFKSWGTTLASFGLSSASIYAPIAFTSPLIINGSSTSDVDIRTGYWYWNLRNNHTSSDAFQIVNETGANSIPLSISKYSTTTLQNRDASYQALIVKGYTSQTANLQEWQNSSGAALSYISSAGNLFFGKEVAHTIKVDQSTTAATAGAALTMSAADGSATTSGAGGALTLNGGSGIAGNSAGGAVTVQGGGGTGLSSGGNVTIEGGAGLAYGTINIGTGATPAVNIGAATKKIGLYAATAVVQATTGGAASTFAANTSGIANDTATWDSYTIGQVVKALRNIGILA